MDLSSVHLDDMAGVTAPLPRKEGQQMAPALSNLMNVSELA